MTPVIGPARETVAAIQAERCDRALFYGGSAILDVFLAKWLANGVVSTWRRAPGNAPRGLLNEGARATELANEALLNKLRARGYTIDQSAEVQRYLDQRGANAATFLNKDLLLRPDARKIEALEEYLHNVQQDIGLLNKMTPAQMEIHVKEFMLRHKKMLGISDADGSVAQELA
ncbi:MAG: hypothetical protein N3E46_04980 [Gemmataceae bacterium]|nr:hypothetical protein [Gemmataceae bacterium]